MGVDGCVATCRQRRRVPSTAQRDASTGGMEHTFADSEAVKGPRTIGLESSIAEPRPVDLQQDLVAASRTRPRDRLCKLWPMAVPHNGAVHIKRHAGNARIHFDRFDL